MLEIKIEGFNMRLDEQDVKLFYKLHPALLFYAIQKLKLDPDVKTIDDLWNLKVEQRIEFHNHLYDNFDIVDSFYNENPANLTEKELGIILSWKKFIKDDFIVYKQYKKYCAFMKTESPAHVYAVLGLQDKLEDVLPYMPVMVNAVLLPWKDQIIYDGIITHQRITFGRSMRESFKDEFEVSKAKFGIIESLPYKPITEEESTTNLLRYYLKSDSNIQLFEEEIEYLINKNENLLKLYHQELGKRYSTGLRKRLKQIGVSDCWFVSIDDLIIASGKSKDEAKENAEKIITKKMREFIFLFQIKG